MASRRNLIVVSNRGPVTYAWSGGERVASRGGGGLVTALRGPRAPSRRDVDRERDVRRGSCCRIGQRRRGIRGDRARRLDVPASPRRARRAGVRLVLQRDRESDAVVPPAPPLGSRDVAEHRPRRAPRVARGVRAGQPRVCGRGARRARPRPARVRLLPRLPPLRGAADRPRRCDRTRASSSSCTSRGPGRIPGRCCRSRSGARSTTACSRTTSSGSTRGAGGATSCAPPRTSSGRCPTGRTTRSATTGVALR